MPRITLICPKLAFSPVEGYRPPTESDYDNIVFFESDHDYRHSGLVEFEAISRHQERPFDRVVALSEYDVHRAARLRDLFGIPGQDSKSATAYRDKFIMKSYLREVGIPVADFRSIDRTCDLLEAFRILGPKIVVKPRWGASSVGVAIIGDISQLRSYISNTLHVDMDKPAILLAEQYIENQMHHVDGLIINGQLLVTSTSRITSQLSFHYGDSTFSVIHDQRSRISEQLTNMAKRAVNALPTFKDGIFHAEIFETPEGKLIFNEIGARIGGQRIQGTVRAAFGIDLVECAVRAQTNRPLPPEVSEAANGPKRAAGYVVFPPRQGQLRTLSTDCPFGWVADYQLLAKVGDRFDRAGSSADYFASMIVTGIDAAEVEARLTEAEAWFWRETRIDSAS